MNSTTEFSLKWNNYSHHVATSLEELRGNDDLTDVTLSCEGKRLKAHKLVLSACSLYFKETFRENPCTHPVVILKGVSFLDLEALVNFMYNGHISISQDHLSSFLETAQLLQVKGLTDEDVNESTNLTQSTPLPTSINISSSNNLENSKIPPEVDPPAPKRKRIGPARFMKQTKIDSSSKSVPGPSGVQSSTGGLINPETIILPPACIDDLVIDSNDSFSNSAPLMKIEHFYDAPQDDLIQCENNNGFDENEDSRQSEFESVKEEDSYCEPGTREEACFGLTQKGKPKLFYGGFPFLLNKTNGSKKFWSCATRRCRGRVMEMNGTFRMVHAHSSCSAAVHLKRSLDLDCDRDSEDVP